MVRSVRIETNKNTVKIIVDDNEIHDVLEYQQSKGRGGERRHVLLVSLSPLVGPETSTEKPDCFLL